MHGYVIDPEDGLDFLQLVERVDAKTLKDIESVSEAPPAAPRLWRHRARGDHPARPAEGRRRLGLGVREGLLYDRLDDRQAQARSADRGGERSQPPALALARARRGAARLDRPLHRQRRPARDRRTSAAAAMPPACSPISAGAPTPIIAASRASTSSPMRPSSASIIRAEPISPRRSSSATRACRPRRRARLKALAGPRLMERARLLGGADARRLSGLGRHGGRPAARRFVARGDRSYCNCRRAWRPSPASG